MILPRTKLGLQTTSRRKKESSHSIASKECWAFPSVLNERINTEQPLFALSLYGCSIPCTSQTQTNLMTDTPVDPMQITKDWPQLQSTTTVTHAAMIKGEERERNFLTIKVITIMHETRRYSKDYRDRGYRTTRAKQIGC